MCGEQRAGSRLDASSQILFRLRYLPRNSIGANFLQISAGESVLQFLFIQPGNAEQCAFSYRNYTLRDRSFSIGRKKIIASHLSFQQDERAALPGILLQCVAFLFRQTMNRNSHNDCIHWTIGPPSIGRLGVVQYYKFESIVFLIALLLRSTEENLSLGCVTDSFVIAKNHDRVLGFV